jgi:hypothetical protein
MDMAARALKLPLDNGVPAVEGPDGPWNQAIVIEDVDFFYVHVPPPHEGRTLRGLPAMGHVTRKWPTFWATGAERPQSRVSIFFTFATQENQPITLWPATQTNFCFSFKRLRRIFLPWHATCYMFGAIVV